MYSGAFFLAKNIIKNSNTNMDCAHDRTLTSLKFISKIQKNEKINVNRDLYALDNNSWATSWNRTFNIENRKGTQQFLENTYERVYTIIENYLHSNDDSKKISAHNIIHDLKESIKGLRNIKETYINDRMFGCKIDNIIENIHVKLIDYLGKEEYAKVVKDDVNVMKGGETYASIVGRKSESPMGDEDSDSEEQDEY